MSALLGQFSFEKLVEYNGLVGPFLYWTYVLIMFFFILSSFVAIIEEAFRKAKEVRTPTRTLTLTLTRT